MNGTKMNHATPCVSLLLLLLMVTPLLFTGPPAQAAGFTPARLRCEYRVNPLGVDSARPRLDWILQANDPAARSLMQSAYHILVASSPALLAKGHGDLWDSGSVPSDRAAQIAYTGKPLHSGQPCWWKVRAWDQARSPSAWSAPAQWTMGLLHQADWQAHWISAPADFQGDDNSTFLLRREFPVKQGLKRAVVSVCGVGQYEMTLNGRKITQDILTPGWTNYRKTCLYDTYDVTSLLHAGPNAAGLLLGNGMYRVGGGRYAKFTGSFGRLQAIAQIRLQYADGSISVVGTDAQWHAGVSPMTFSNVYGGEDWDARKEQKGWDSPGAGDGKEGGWPPAEVLAGPGGTLKGVSLAAPPIRSFDVHKPISHKEIKPNVTVYDLGQNASHVTRFTVHGPAGSVVRVTPDELIEPDGSLFYNNYNGKAFSQYTLSGSGSERYTSRFYYCGDRYLQVECLPAPGGGEVPQIESIEGVVVHSSSTPIGEFSCSNDLFNRIYDLVRWSQRSNMVSVLTDCPHRERLGWLEESHLNGPSLRYNFDVSALSAKITQDMADSQLDNGLVPDIAPEYAVFGGPFRDSAEWGSAVVLVPWQQYEWTGDVEILRRNYKAMAAYVDYLTSRAHDGIAAGGLGDWEGQGTPTELTATAFHYQDTVILAEAAGLLGNVQEQAVRQQAASQIRDAFNKKYFHPDTNQYAAGSQCSNALALVMGLAEPADRPAILNNLVADLQTRHYALTAADIGFRYVLRALADGGRSDIIYAMNNQSDTPGYGYQLKMGATSLAESWDARRDNSQDHFMLGHIMEWFFHDLAGIQPDAGAPGFQKIILKPTPVGDITWAKARYDSLHGPILSDWKRDGKTFTLHAVVPANTTATVYIPTDDPQSVRESGKPAAHAAGVSFLRMEGPAAVYQTGSGSYTFTTLSKGL